MKTPVKYWIDGFNAADQGLPESACPLLWKAWPRDAWIDGHRFWHTYKTPLEPATLERAEITPEEQGSIAFMRKLDLQDCPYGPDTAEYKDWQQGWIEAYENAMHSVDEDDAQEAYMHGWKNNIRRSSAWPLFWLILANALVVVISLAMAFG